MKSAVGCLAAGFCILAASILDIQIDSVSAAILSMVVGGSSSLVMRLRTRKKKDLANLLTSFTTGSLAGLGIYSYYYDDIVGGLQKNLILKYMAVGAAFETLTGEEIKQFIKSWLNKGS